MIAGHRQPSWVFYLEPTRAWELLAGGVCAYLGPALRTGPKARWLLHAAGLALIGLCVFVFDDSLSWPSAWPAVPVAGAALVIVARVGDARWAKWPPVAALGGSSYSTYIWHWPIIMALRYEGARFTPWVTLACIAVCLIVGLVSYWSIERWTTERMLAMAGGTRWAVGWLSVVALAGFAWSASAAHGFEAMRTGGLSPAVVAALADDRKAQDDWAFPTVCGQLEAQGPLRLCRLGDPAARAVLAIGDSHAEQFAARYAHAFAADGAGITFVTSGGCPPVPGVAMTRAGSRCAQWTAAAYRLAETGGYRRVVIAAAWPIYFEPGARAGGACFAGPADCQVPSDPSTFRADAIAAFHRLAAELTRLRVQGKEVAVIGPNPTSDAADPALLYCRAFWTGDIAPPPFSLQSLQARIGFSRDLLIQASQAGGAVFVDPLNALCPDGLCPIEAAGRTLYKDGSHFRASAVTQPRFAYLDPWLRPDMGDRCGCTRHARKL